VLGQAPAFKTLNHCNAPARNAADQVRACGFRPKFFHAIKNASDNTVLVIVKEKTM
jgi:hypothetical protein